MAKDRMRSVNSTVKRELSGLFLRDVNPSFEQCLITITDVETSPDLRYCKVFISVMGTASQRDKVFQFLERKTQEYYHYLGTRMHMKYIPKLQWYNDETPEKADKMMRLLDSLEIDDSEDQDEL